MIGVGGAALSCNGKSLLGRRLSPRDPPDDRRLPARRHTFSVSANGSANGLRRLIPATSKNQYTDMSRDRKMSQFVNRSKTMHTYQVRLAAKPGNHGGNVTTEIRASSDSGARRVAEAQYPNCRVD